MTDHVRVEMMNVEATLIREAADRTSQESMALTYAFGLVGSEEINWARVNQAILQHRSMTALKRIKTLAWKRVEERRRCEPAPTSADQDRAA